MKTMLFNPYSGKPRDPRDIVSDPAGTLMIDPDDLLQAAPKGDPVILDIPSGDLRDKAEKLVTAGHEFWQACRDDAGGGAVRWLTQSDGTTIIFTRGEYADALLKAIPSDYTAPNTVFDDGGGEEIPHIQAFSTPPAASGSAEPVAFLCEWAGTEDTAERDLVFDRPASDQAEYDKVTPLYAGAPPSQQAGDKHWYETCEGSGSVHQEHQAGCHVGGDYPCPDCDGKGYWMPRTSVSAKDADAWMTRNDDGDPAMLFFDKQEAMQYTDGEEPEALILRDGITPAASKGAA